MGDRQVSLTDTDLRMIRAEVGSSPSDDDLYDAWDAAADDGIVVEVRWAAVAAQIIGERLADQQAGSVSVSIPGAIAVSTSSGGMAGLATQLARLRSIAGLGGAPNGGRLTRPSSRSRLDRPVFPPRI
jgi:hypothetical protein